MNQNIPDAMKLPAHPVLDFHKSILIYKKQTDCTAALISGNEVKIKQMLSRFDI